METLGSDPGEGFRVRPRVRYILSAKLVEFEDAPAEGVVPARFAGVYGECSQMSANVARAVADTAYHGQDHGRRNIRRGEG